MRLLVYNTEGKIFGKLSMHVETQSAGHQNNAWFNFACYHPPPGNPRDKSSPSGPGVGNCLKRFCRGARGAGQIENNFSFFL